MCLSGGGETAERLISRGADVGILGIRDYHSPLSVVKVISWLRRRKIAIAHTHGYPAGVLGRVSAISCGIPCIFHHVHSTYLDLGRRNHLIERLLGLFTERVICCSEAVRKFVLEKEGIPAGKLAVVHNGVAEPDSRGMDAAAMGEFRKSLHIAEGAPIIGCVASLTGHKGHRYLLDAVKGIPEAYLLLVGDGPLREEISAAASASRIRKRVVFAGSAADVAPYLRCMDVVVLPSPEREGLPLAAIEAMAMAKPVVASDIGGIPEAVSDGETGILVRPADGDALGGALKRLLGSRELMNAMGLSGRNRYLSMFRLDDMLRKMEGLYGQCRQANI